MLTTKPTPEMIQERKNIYENHHDKLIPNRKSGEVVKEYFCAKYKPEEIRSSGFIDVVKDNTIFVGIDLVTGFYHIEGEDMEAVADIYDDLFVFRGLDEKDLRNFFLVAQYVQCLEN